MLKSSAVDHRWFVSPGIWVFHENRPGTRWWLKDLPVRRPPWAEWYLGTNGKQSPAMARGITPSSLWVQTQINQAAITLSPGDQTGPPLGWLVAAFNRRATWTLSGPGLPSPPSVDLLCQPGRSDSPP